MVMRFSRGQRATGLKAARKEPSDVGRDKRNLGTGTVDTLPG